ncbi:hypothetical protein GTY67_19680 [Streptomyces sp. SID8374]|uniref:hypothetical protein n=1 Tax=Streptomyces sp. SID8374 TaxID=2690354 RepID=UPI00136C6406|nr:hypothetical protein [Streptomyces sp. SID8374]MYX15583.1 hypothetical protein [Streptomyces sp. SID8374]
MHRVGIESDQLVYDYLSRVGDLAQQQQLSSGARMRLVSTLRGEIDRRRASEGADSPAAVRRIIGRLGSPAELVSAAAESGDGSVPLPSARTGGGAGLPRPRSGFLRKSPKEPEAPGAPDEPRPASGPASGPVPDPGPKAGSWRGASRWGAGGGARAGSGRSGDADAGRAEARFRTETGYASDSRTDFTKAPGPDSRTNLTNYASDSRTDLTKSPGADPRTGSGPGDHPRTDFTKSTGPDEDLPADPTPWPHPSAPHVLGPDQQSSDDEWWRLEPGPFDAGTAIPGFFGGIEAPELLGRRPQKPDAADKEEEGDGLDAEDTEEGDGTDEQEPRRALRIPRPRRRKPVVVAEPVVAAAPARRGGFAHPLLLLAAVLLIAGVVTGSWIPLAGGWLIAYGSRTLSRTEAKWAALGLPGVVVAGALVWVWGRVDGRWGEPIEDGALREVLVGAWPVVVRVAAVASALYLVWRARRRA